MPRHPRTAATRLGLARVERYEEVLAWPQFVAAFLWIGCFTAVWADQHPSALVRHVCALLLFAIWVWLIGDYLIRLVLSGRDRARFVKTRIFDFMTIVIPFFRPFMILVFVWRLPVFKNGTRGRMRVRYAVVTVLFAFLYVYVCSYLVWVAEKDAPNAQIVNFGDAVWWGFTTISTVGYGDFVPITMPGRALAVGLMVGGVLVVGVTTATLLSSLSEQLQRFALVGPSGGEKGDSDGAQSGGSPDADGGDAVPADAALPAEGETPRHSPPSPV